jgi:hypothetical protein
MGIFNILGDAFDLLVKNPKVVVPQIALLILFNVLLISMFGSQTSVSQYPISLNQSFNQSVQGAASVQSAGGIGTAASLIVLLALTIIMLLINIFLTGFYITMVKKAKAGLLPMKDAFGKMKSVYGSLLYTDIAGVLVAIVAGVVAVIAFLALSQIGMLGDALAIAVIVAYILAIAILGYQLNVVVILEKAAGLGAVKRSINIGKKNVMPIFGIVLLPTLLYLILVFALGIVTVIIAPQSASGGIAADIVSILGSVVGGTYSVWITFASVLFYGEYVKNRK